MVALDPELEPSLAASIEAVGHIMQQAKDRWWIISSAAVALHGADAGRVADVDLLLSMADAARILPTLGIDVRPGPCHPDFRSDIFATWHGAPLPVEFMAGFSCRVGAQWRMIWPETRQAVQVGTAAIFVPERTELRRIIEAFGRPKDMARARSLAALA